MSAEIRSEIQKLTKIQLREKDFLGQGRNALVYRYKILNTPIAVKCFQTQEKAQDEMNILQGIKSLLDNCPGIIECYGMKKIQIEMQSEISQKYVIFLQACEIDLQKKMLMMQKLSMPQILDLFSQLSLSLLCIHLNNCFHGDIKPANIFVNKKDQQFSYYFGDFGEGKITGNYISIDFETLSLRGTPFYLSPELWKILNERKSAGNYDPLSADVYALGITILSMIVPQQFIFDLTAIRGNSQQYKNQILKIKQELLKVQEFNTNSGNQLLNALLQMVNFDPIQRPSAVQICFAIVQSKQLCMKGLSSNNMQALIAQLIQSLYWQKKQKKELQKELESQKTIIEILQNQPNLEIPSFSSDIIKNSEYMNIILALFESTNISLKRIHLQLNIQKFNGKQFHDDCDGNGPTLVIMHSQEEPNSFFGGMAAPSWNQKKEMIADPPNECSWIFKIEFTNSKLNLHQWKCINKNNAIAGFPDGFQFGYDGLYGGGLLLEGYGGGLGYEGGFGGLGGGEYGEEYGEYGSQLQAKNDFYQKVEFNKETKILTEIKKKFSINYPPKVFGKIMNEEYCEFKLDSLEVFSIKK